MFQLVNQRLHLHGSLTQMGEVQGEGKILQCHVHFAEQKAAVQALHSWDQFYCGACVLLTLK